MKSIVFRTKYKEQVDAIAVDYDELIWAIEYAKEAFEYSPKIISLSLSCNCEQIEELREDKYWLTDENCIPNIAVLLFRKLGEDIYLNVLFDKFESATFHVEYLIRRIK